MCLVPSLGIREAALVALMCPLLDKELHEAPFGSCVPLPSFRVEAVSGAPFPRASGTVPGGCCKARFALVTLACPAPFGVKSGCLAPSQESEALAGACSGALCWVSPWGLVGRVAERFRLYLRGAVWAVS